MSRRPDGPAVRIRLPIRLRKLAVVHKNGGGRGGALMQWRGVRRVRGAPRRNRVSCGWRACGRSAGCQRRRLLVIAVGRPCEPRQRAPRPARPSRSNRSTARRRTSSASWSPNLNDEAERAADRRGVARRRRDLPRARLCRRAGRARARPHSPGSGTSTTPTSGGPCASAGEEAGRGRPRPRRLGGADEQCCAGSPATAWTGSRASSTHPAPAAARPSRRRHAGVGRDDSPEAAGIFRVLGDRDQPAARPRDPQAATDKPLRRSRASRAGVRRACRARRRRCALDRRLVGPIAPIRRKASGQRSGRIARPQRRLVITTAAQRAQERRHGGEERSDQARRRQLQSRARRGDRRLSARPR